jgi:hypothetical protein
VDGGFRRGDAMAMRESVLVSVIVVIELVAVPGPRQMHPRTREYPIGPW